MSTIPSWLQIGIPTPVGNGILLLTEQTIDHGRYGERSGTLTFRFYGDIFHEPAPKPSVLIRDEQGTPVFIPYSDVMAAAAISSEPPPPPAIRSPGDFIHALRHQRKLQLPTPPHHP
jgi:hypothetical protein